MYCTKCGKHNPKGSKFCKNCDSEFKMRALKVEKQVVEKQPVIKAQKAVFSNKASKHMPFKLIVLGVVFLVLLLAGGGYGLYYGLHKITVPAQHKTIGSNVDVSGSKVPVFIKATKVNENAIPLKNAQSLGPEVEISPGGSLSAAITLRFKLDKVVKKDDIVVIATKETPNGTWSYIAPTISDDGQYATLETNHLSIWKPLEVLIDFAKNFKQEVINNLTGDYTETADKPKCDGEREARTDDYQISSSNKDTLYWCFGMENSKRVLKVVNRKRYPLDLIHPGLKVMSAGHIVANLEQLARLGSGNHTILFPHDEAEFSVDVPMNQNAGVRSSYSLGSGEAVTLDALESALNVVGSMLPTSGVGKALTETEKYKTLNTALRSKDCYNAVANRNLANLLLDCVGSDAVEKTLGPQAIILDFVKSLGGLANWFASAISGNVDAISQKADYTVVITRGNSVSSLTASNSDNSSSGSVDSQANMPCPTPTPGGGSISTNAYWELCGASLVGGDSLFPQNGSASNQSANQSGCPVGEPTIKVDNVSITDQGTDIEGKHLLYVITGVITNTASADVIIREVAFYYGNFNSNLAPHSFGIFTYPNSGIKEFMEDSNVELVPKSNIVKAQSTTSFKIKDSLAWDTAHNGPYPTTFSPLLKYPDDDTSRPTNHWMWAGLTNGTIPGTCDPNYYQIGN